MEEFERFNRTTTPTPKRPFVTVQRRGNLSFNRSTFELLDEPEALELLFSKANQVIGLKAAPPEEPYAFPVKPVPGRSPESKPPNYMVSCVSFMNHYGIERSVSRRYLVERRDDGIVTVDLKQGGVEVSPTRAGAGRAARGEEERA